VLRTREAHAHTHTHTHGRCTGCAATLQGHPSLQALGGVCAHSAPSSSSSSSSSSLTHPRTCSEATADLDPTHLQEVSDAFAEVVALYEANACAGFALAELVMEPLMRCA